MKAIKRVSAAVAAAALVITLAPSAMASQSAMSRKDRTFVTIVRAEMDEFTYVSATQIVKLGKLTCKVLNQGVDETDAAWAMVDNGFDVETAAMFVGAAIASYCPSHGGDIRSEDKMGVQDVAHVAFLAVQHSARVVLNG